jgi:two-component system alkaline phosphatase synthesis response regulator PhoP
MTPAGTVTVLIIDDNPTLLAIFADGLPLVGNYRVLTAADGAAGLDLYYREHPDCVVIDIKMPELNGFQVARALRGDPDTADTPLIMLTALPQEQTELASMISGCDQFLSKPVVPSELDGAIQRALRVSADERAQRMRHLAQDDDV